MELDEQEDPNEYVVEEIRQWRWNLKKKCREFHIKWLNYPEEQNSWEPEKHLNCEYILEKFVKSLDKHQLKCYHSKRPIRLNGFQRKAKYLGVLGADRPQRSDKGHLEKSSKREFRCLLKFDGQDELEEVPIQHYYDYQPDEALKFFEARILIKKH